MMLESRLHADNCFVTLTYSQENYPASGSVSPREMQLWLKRLRKLIPLPIRYFVCGEYGDQTQRAHYHAVLFGVGIECTELIRQSWGKGHVFVGLLEEKSAQYVAGYVTKKMTSQDDERLKGRHPEFARMSLRPGIGAGAMEFVANVLTSDSGSRLVANTGDVPPALSGAARRTIPLGRYLRRRLRHELGSEEMGSPPGAIARQVEELRALHADSGSHEAFREAVTQPVKVGQVENRAKIWRKKGTL